MLLTGQPVWNGLWSDVGNFLGCLNYGTLVQLPRNNTTRRKPRPCGEICK